MNSIDNKFILTQNKFDTFINEASKMEEPRFLKNFFSEEIIKTVTTMDKEAIDSLIQKINTMQPEQKTLDIILGKLPIQNIYNKNEFILSKNDTGEQMRIAEVTGYKHNPRLKSDTEFDVSHAPMRGKRIHFDKALLDTNEANHSAFIAYLTRTIGRCIAFSKTSKYPEPKRNFAAWVFACEICRDLSDRGFPVLEGFASLEAFRDFVNLNILKEAKSIASSRLFTNKLLGDILGKNIPQKTTEEPDTPSLLTQFQGTRAKRKTTPKEVA